MELKRRLKKLLKKSAQWECIECGNPFQPECFRPDLVKYCRIKCKKVRENRIRNQKKRLPSKKNYVEDINPRVLFEKDKGICQLCGLKINQNVEWPDPRSATIDHIIPVSEGGKNSYENAQLTCLKCNNDKNTETQKRDNDERS